MVLPVSSLIAYSACTFVAFTVSRFILHLTAVRRSLQYVPGPSSPSWLWGQEWSLYSSCPGARYVDWHRQFGKVVKFTGAFGHQHLSIIDPRAVSFIVNEGIYDLPKPHGVRAWFKETLGEGIVWVEGREAHERHRRSVAPALSSQSVRNCTSIFYENSAKIVQHWMQRLDTTEDDQCEIEVTNWAGRYALDTIARAAFAYDFDCLSGERHALVDALDGLTNNENKSSSFYMRAIFWVFPSILSIGDKGAMIRRSKSVLGNVASSVWRDAQIAGDPDAKNLMAIMLKGDTSNENWMSEGQIIDQMRTIVSAGYETVSATISWVLYELAIHPQLQQQLREEIPFILDPSFDDFNAKFPLLDAVLKETLRCHPPILENHHQAAETISIPLSECIPGTADLNLIVPKGTILCIPVNVVQSNRDIWGDDADVFRPQRWLERKDQHLGLREAQLFAFSQGPRGCVGKAFAICEIKALVVTLVRHFSFTCSHDIEPFQSFVVRPRIVGTGASSLPLLIKKL